MFSKRFGRIVTVLALSVVSLGSSFGGVHFAQANGLTLTADKVTVGPDEVVTFTSNALTSTLAAAFVDGVRFDLDEWGEPPKFLPHFGCPFPFPADVVVTVSLYNETYNPATDYNYLTINTTFAASVSVTFTDCESDEDEEGVDGRPSFDLDLDHYLRRAGRETTLPDTL
jgi:hypothetical protein